MGGKETRLHTSDHDDGERIIVRIPRRYLLQFTGPIAFLGLLAVLAASSAYILPPDQPEPIDWLLSALFFGLIAYLYARFAILPFARSIRRNPALIVNADGIRVYLAGAASGKGLLPWYEIAWVGHEIQLGPGFSHQSLIINLFQFPDDSASKPLIESPSPAAPYPFTTTVLRIAEELLDIPVDKLADEIERYIEVHAPPGWHGELSDKQMAHIWVAKPEPLDDLAAS